MKPNLIFIKDDKIIEHLYKNNVKEFNNQPNCFDVNLLNLRGVSLDELKINFSYSDDDFVSLKDNSDFSKIRFN